jgi:hypothetical protein
MLALRSHRIILLMLALCLGPVASAQLDLPTLTNLPPLETCLDVLKLTPEQARENRPVHVRGTITSYVPASQLCFVQDETAGVYVQPSPWPRELQVGEVVEVEGVAAEGRFSPIIQFGTIKRTGERRPVPARRISVEELNTGRFDCQFVEVEGVLQRAEVNGNVVDLRIAVGGSSLTALIFSLENPPTNWVDSIVRVRGVAGTFYSGDQLSGFGVFLQDSSFFEVIRSAPEPFSQPLRTTTKLAWYSPEGMIDHRIRLQGTVTLTWPGKAFFLRDDAGVLRIAPANPARMPEKFSDGSPLAKDRGHERRDPTSDPYRATRRQHTQWPACYR